MIRDFWGVTSGNLAGEIDLIKDKIPADQYRVLNGVSAWETLEHTWKRM